MSDASDKLAQCVRSGRHEQAAALLRRVSPCELPPGAKWTALHLAAHLGRLRVLRVFLQYLAGATKEAAKGGVDVRDRRRRTALHLAARAGHAAAVKLLLRAGASLDARDEAGDTPVVAAAAGGRAEVVPQLLMAPGGNSRASAVSEALAAALARAHCVKTAHAVLRARPRVAVDENVMTKALLSLCQSYAEKSPMEKCPLSSAKLLCNLGADVDAVDEDGWSVLHYAAAWG
jgi:ankyrin repeat protein